MIYMPESSQAESKAFIRASKMHMLNTSVSDNELWVVFFVRSSGSGLVVVAIKGEMQKYN